MKELLGRKITVSVTALAFSLAAVATLAAYGVYNYIALQRHFETTAKDLGGAIEELRAHLASSTIENRDLNDYLTILKARNTDFQNEIQEIGVKVSTLEKLKATDPELLQKYSKVYFLSENYVPAELSLIEPDYLFNKAKPVQFHTKAKGYLEMMVRAARADGVDISVLSGFRSFGYQAALKSQYTVVYGTNSNRFSADQGYSEHQLGTAADFTTKKSGETFAGFEATPAYAWLLANAHKFGFVLSYPKGNAYYVFEPWHWRFVGVALAGDLNEQKKRFYEMPQRDLDGYLIKLFD